MPPISYCSLDEAWGMQKKFNKDENNINRFDKLSEDSQKERNTVIDNMNYVERNTKNNNNSPNSEGSRRDCSYADPLDLPKVVGATKEQMIPNDITSRQALIGTSEFQKYRTNSMDKVVPLKSTSNNLNDNNDSNKSYKKDIICNDIEKEKQRYKERLAFLENELQKCKNYLEICRSTTSPTKTFQNMIPENSEENTIESFQNSNNNSYNSFYTSNTSTDIIDLIFLIIIGLVIIFIMNSIFKLGKSIGSR
jgi:hypothetical protein